jgi:insulinase (Peptidase family M16)/peptidase M16-like protein
MGKTWLWPALASSLAGLTMTIATSAGAEQLACETVERYKLPNGIDVVLQADHRLPLVAVVSSVHAGARNDPPGYSGLAHYVEHLLFREGGQFVSAFNLYDGSGATINGTTTPDTTNYFALLPSEQLERALWIEARRLGLGLNVVENATAEVEKEVVMREFSQRGGESPTLLAAQARRDAMYPVGHPYRSLNATDESVEGQSLAAARWFFAEHYRLDRVRLIVAGDFEPAATRALIERHYGGLADPPRPAPSSAPADAASADECRWAKQPIVPNKKRVALYTRSRSEGLAITWPVPPGLDPDALRTTMGVLVSKVAERARELGVSHRVYSQVESLELAKAYSLYIDIMPGQDFEKAEPLVWASLAELNTHMLGYQARQGVRRTSELFERLTRPSLLDRALKLTARECFEQQCAPPSAEIKREYIATFARDRALVYEMRYGANAPFEGSLEVSP